MNLVLRLREFVRCKLGGPRQHVWKHPFPTETALPLEPSEKIFCDAEISGCSRCSCYPVVPPLHLLRTTRPGSSSTLRSRRSLRSLARCAATKRFSNILKINEKSINITTKTWKTSSEERLGRAKLVPSWTHLGGFVDCSCCK